MLGKGPESGGDLFHVNMAHQVIYLFLRRVEFLEQNGKEIVNKCLQLTPCGKYYV
jgi:hypothetical protein